jgi:hypothetical protein
VDLGTRRQLVINHYALRGNDNCNWSLRNWELQGSENGTSTSSWTTLRRHDDERTLEDTPVPYPVAHWPVEGVTTPYRHFRILQHGLNSRHSGGQRIMVQRHRAVRNSDRGTHEFLHA